MSVAKLSKRTVDALKPGDNSFIAYDTSLKGFGVRVLPSGAKSWVIEYRPGGGGRYSITQDFAPEGSTRTPKPLRLVSYAINELSPGFSASTVRFESFATDIRSPPARRTNEFLSPPCRHRTGNSGHVRESTGSKLWLESRKS